MNNMDIKRISDATLRRFRDSLAEVAQELGDKASEEACVTIGSLHTMADLELRKREVASMRSIMGKPLPLRDKTPA